MIASRFTGRRVLLAVGALALAAPTAIQVARVASSPAPRTVVVVVPAPTPVVVQMMQPTVLPSGAPACGNVIGKPVMRPRVMPSGAPACGNVTARPIPGVERNCP